MAQASRSLPSEFCLENPSNAVVKAPFLSVPPPAIPSCYILKFENGLFLRDYLDSQCVLTAVLGEAKSFYSLGVAERNARLLKATVVPGPQVESSRAASMSFLPAVASVRNLTAVEMLASCIVESANNAVWVGVQKGFTHHGKKTPPLALFNSRKTGSTLALPLLELSTDRVRNMVNESDETFVKPVVEDRSPEILSRLRQYREAEFQKTSEAYRQIVDGLGA
jgi:hypothetical protein